MSYYRFYVEPSETTQENEFKGYEAYDVSVMESSYISKLTFYKVLR